jgi:hypothetical protein
VSAAKQGVISSRKALSGLFAVLTESLEAEFAPVFSPGEGSEDRVPADVFATVEGQAGIVQDLIRTFRLYDGVGPAMCTSVFVIVARLLAAWGSKVTAAGVPSLAYLVPSQLPAARSCAVDALVAIVLLAKV